MTKRLLFLLAFLLGATVPIADASAQLSEGTRFVKTKLIANVTSIQPSSGEGDVQPQVGVLFDISPGWHIYWKDSGEAAQPTVVSWTLPNGWSIGELQWPMPMKFVERGNITTFGYRNEVLLFANLPNPDFIPHDREEINLQATVHWLVCKDICVPGQSTLSLTLPFSTSLPLGPSADFPLFQKYAKLVPPANLTKDQIPLAPPLSLVPETNGAGLNGNGGLFVVFASAFVAGILLNLMPCVLPVLSIKVMGFVGQVEQTKSQIVRSALVFMAGILASFLALALTVIALKGFGHSVGWGFQFQYPAFVVGLTVLVFVLSLAFFDVYTVTFPQSQTLNRACSQIENHYGKHFFEGMLVTALSTPCTAPFLGTALAFAFTQSAAFVIAIFLTVGFGLSIPYLIFSTNEKLLHLLPRPGTWMYRFREFMGFLLLATVIWLLYVLSKLTEDGAIWTLVSLLLVYISLWLKRAFDQMSIGERLKKIITAALVVWCAMGFIYLWPRMIHTTQSNLHEAAPGEIKWEAFSAERLAQLRAARTPVFLDFTAEWCITCKANEHLVLNTAEVAQAFKDYGFVTMKADWTGGNPAVTEALHEYGGNGVPLYVVSGGQLAEPIILPSILTQNILLDALARVR